jgi:hypothetical protein
MERDWVQDLPGPNRKLIPLIDRIRTEICQADRAWSIYETVGRFSEDINTKNFGDVFASIQGACLDQLTLSLTKLFEQPNQRYEILSVPVLLSTVEGDADNLVILQGNELRKLFNLPRLRCPTPDATISRQLAARLQANLPRPEQTEACELSRTLVVHKTRRDKSVAHPEAVDPTTFPVTTWEDSKRLLDIAKHAVGVIGLTYASLALIVDDGSYLLTSDAQRGGAALRRLFRSAGIEPNASVAG